MTVLDMNFIGSILPAIFGSDPRYVVRRQGNWFNPQDSMGYPAKPITWIAYTIEDEHPITLPHYASDTTPANWSVIHSAATIAIQFVGERARAQAASMLHWAHRDDVFQAFSQVDGVILPGSFKMTATDFYQDGLNTIRAYTVRFDVVYASEIETGQPQTSDPVNGVKKFVFTGGVN